MTRTLLAIGAVIASGMLGACTVKQAEQQSPSGPSGLATSVTLTATPDSILQDGGSQSSIAITAIDDKGRGKSGLPIRLAIIVGGVAQDYGSLSARTVVTDNSGKALAIYTAPPTASPLAGGSGVTVTIQADATATDATTSPVGGLPSVSIRLVPPGVILPPADTPTARFTMTPTPVNFNIPVTFDASTSCPGNVGASGCAASSSSLVSYQWTFGDGASASGKVVTHTYTASTEPTTSFNVTLTVTNDRTVSASTTQAVSVTGAVPPSGDWVNSPVNPVVGQSVIFNADQIKAAAGHRIVEYNWNFGDGSTGTGFLTTHTFTAANTYTVVLSVRDDADAKTVLPKTITVGSGNPSVEFVAAVANAATHSMTFDGSGSVANGSATIVSYQWAFGDGSFAGPNSTATVSHTYAIAGSYSVTLTVTDSLGRIGRKTSSIAVP